jgi:quinohemoprotein ethanol dehydrogenase
MTKSITLRGALWLGLQLEVAVAAPHAVVDDARLSKASSEPQNWLAHAGAHPDWYFSGLDKLNVTNVGRLRPAWYVELDTSRGQEATPLIADGTLYTTTAWSKVLAVDARTGRVKWSFDPEVPGHAGYKSCCDVVNRGPALYRDNLYITTIDGRLIALSAATGKFVWSALTVDPARMSAVTGAPRVMQGRVIIGNAGGETGARGYVSAYDASDGKLLWRFYTVPGTSGSASDGAASDAALTQIARQTWSGYSYESGGGGQVWNAITPDPRFGQIYIGTANPFPWNPKFRSTQHNDYLFTDSIVALDARTGQYRWHYQEVPDDAWDYDATEDMILLDARIDGEDRAVLMQAAKDGFFYILDRKTGKLLSATAFVEGMTWARGVDAVSGRPLINPESSYAVGSFAANPGPNGAHSWRPSSYNPLTGLVYIPTAETGVRFTGAQSYKFQEGVDDLGVTASVDAVTATSGNTPLARRPSEYLQAWNPLARRREWQVPTIGGGGVLSTAGNLVFQGQHRKVTAGELVAYRADTGKQLWSFSTPNAVLTGPVTYSVAGEQYVVVMTGAGGSADLLVPGSGATLLATTGKLIAFKLDGTATLPPDPEAAPPAWPVTVSASEQAVRRGSVLYERYCARCHGRDAKSRNVVPDLRRAPPLGDAAAWKSIVLDGALEEAGMIGWRRFISAQDAENIRAYVAAQAHVLATETPSGNRNQPR